MHISHIDIENFRNFKRLSLDLCENTVIVGENKIGKSNLIYALRLILDPRIPDSERQLRIEDFWDGLPRPIDPDKYIKISVDITDFEEDENLMAILAEHLVQAEPMVSRLTYLFRPIPSLKEPPRKDADYEYLVFGGERPENLIGYEVRKWIPLSLLPALRNAEDDLASWSHSPLAPLLRAVSASISRDTLEQAAAEVTTATSKVSDIEQIKTLADLIQEKIDGTVGVRHSLTTNLGFAPVDPDRILRSLRLFIDNGKRGVGDASLGSSNLLYLTLLTLELERQVQAGERNHTFLAIEEPEAHLHPHIQRLIYKEFLATRSDPEKPRKPQSVILTTHSPHIVSVSPLKSIVVLKKSVDGASTIGKSTAKLDLDEKTIKDLERYLDTNKGEIVFAKGILLVEGPAEEFIIPKLLDINFDEWGISVCSVNGTKFEPYVKLLGTNGLDIPFAVITDFDPGSNGKTLGIPRVRNLLKFIETRFDIDGLPDADIPSFGERFGLFLNSRTLEVDLFNAGNQLRMCQTLAELTTNGAAKARAESWEKDHASVDYDQLLNDINEVGKGRYAQRLASVIDKNKCPEYINKAVEHVTNCIQ